MENKYVRLKNIDEEIKGLEERLKDVKGTECECYSRCCGYLRSVTLWNRGKQEEFKDRVVFKMSKEIAYKKGLLKR